MVYRLKITELDDDLSPMIFYFLIRSRCQLASCILFCSATSFAAWTRVNCASKIFEDDPKTSPNNNCMDVSAEFSKFARGRRGKTVTMRFGNVITSVIMSALTRSQTGRLSVTKMRRQNAALFLFNKIN